MTRRLLSGLRAAAFATLVVASVGCDEKGQATAPGSTLPTVQTPAEPSVALLENAANDPLRTAVNNLAKSRSYMWEAATSPGSEFITGTVSSDGYVSLTLNHTDCYRKGGRTIAVAPPGFKDVADMGEPFVAASHDLLPLEQAQAVCNAIPKFEKGEDPKGPGAYTSYSAKVTGAPAVDLLKKVLGTKCPDITDPASADVKVTMQLRAGTLDRMTFDLTCALTYVAHFERQYNTEYMQIGQVKLVLPPAAKAMLDAGK